MRKYKTLIIFLALISLWSAFFSIFKFFLWGSLEETLKPDLETISGYISLGGVFAYLIGGAVSTTFLKKYLLSALSLLTFIILGGGFLLGIDNHIMLGVFVILIGITYGLWAVLKNILISIEIVKTGLKDTLINALAGIFFVVFLIIGTIVGSLLFEEFGNNGVYVILLLLIISSILPLFLDYDKKTLTSLLSNGFKNYYLERQFSFKKSLKSYIPEVGFISKKYFKIMLTSSFFWAITTIVSLQVIQLSTEKFGKTNSEAAILMLYSAVGVIIGNMLSIKMEEKRWFFFRIFTLAFALLVFILPFVAMNYLVVSIMAFIIGIFFGISSNLIDAYFFRKIGEDDRKEYGSSTYGLILSTVLFIMMFVSSFISNSGQYGFTVLMMLFGIVIFGFGILKFE